jgi:hypothetical protein
MVNTGDSDRIKGIFGDFDKMVEKSESGINYYAHVVSDISELHIGYTPFSSIRKQLRKGGIEISLEED